MIFSSRFDLKALPAWVRRIDLLFVCLCSTRASVLMHLMWFFHCLFWFRILVDWLLLVDRTIEINHLKFMHVFISYGFRFEVRHIYIGSIGAKWKRNSNWFFYNMNDLFPIEECVDRAMYVRLFLSWSCVKISITIMLECEQPKCNVNRSTTAYINLYAFYAQHTNAIGLFVCVVDIFK